MHTTADIVDCQIKPSVQPITYAQYSNPFYATHMQLLVRGAGVDGVVSMFMHCYLTSAMLLVVMGREVVLRKKSASPGNTSLVPSVKYNLLLPPVSFPPVNTKHIPHGGATPEANK